MLKKEHEGIGSSYGELSGRGRGGGHACVAEMRGL